MAKQEILLKWEGPKEIALYNSQQALKGAWIKFFRVLVIIIIAEAIAWWIFASLPYKEMGLEIYKPLLYTFLFSVGMSLYAFVIGPYFYRYSKTTYQLTDKQLKVISSSSQKFYNWEKIEDFKIEDNEEFPEFKFISFRYCQRYRTIFLPDEETLEKILAIFNQKVTPKPSEQTEEITFSKLELWFLFIISPIFTFIYFYFAKKLPEEFGESILAFSLFFGGGTIGVMLLKGARNILKSKKCFSNAVGFNFIGLMICMVVLFAVKFLEIYRFFNQ